MKDLDAALDSNDWMLQIAMCFGPFYQYGTCSRGQTLRAQRACHVRHMVNR